MRFRSMYTWLFISLLDLSPALEASDWSTWRGDRSRSGRYGASGDVTEPAVLWGYRLGNSPAQPNRLVVDYDGDGADELLLGARTASVDASEAGGVYFFFGGGLSGTVSVASADASWGASSSGARLGWDLSVGDVDGDGVQDWSSGAYATPSPNNSGTAWLVSGSGYTAWTTGLNIEDSARAAVQGDVGGMYVGRTPFILADMNGDGADEWMVSGEGVARGSTKRAGQVSIFYGP